MKEKLKKFILENNIEFNEGSCGDSNILALCGYALFIGASVDECIIVAENKKCNKEIKRLYDYSKNNNYGNWWNSDPARSQYKF